MKRTMHWMTILFVAAMLTACGGDKGKEAPSGKAASGGETASQAEPAAKENPITAGKTGIFELEGEITKINTILNNFVLITKEGDVEVQVRAMSRMSVNGERVALSQIKPGAQAKGTFKKWNGQDAVMELTITQ